MKINLELVHLMILVVHKTMLTVRRNGTPYDHLLFHSLPGIGQANQPISNSTPITNSAIKQKLQIESGRKSAKTRTLYRQTGSSMRNRNRATTALVYVIQVNTSKL